MWFLGYLMSFLIAIGLVRYYAEPRTNRGIMAIVTLSWGLGFSYFLVLPFDIANAFCTNCEIRISTYNASSESCTCLPTAGVEILADFIPIAYSITMLLGYVMNDLLRGFLDSGEFTRRGRIKDALVEAAYFYVPVLIIGICFLIYLLATTSVGVFAVRDIGRTIINALNLLILIAFMSHGLVEVPRDLWNKGNTEGLLRYYKFRVAVQSEALQNVRRKLEEMMELVQSTEAVLRHQPKGEVLREHMGAIMRRCPPSVWRQATQAMRPVNGEGSPETDMAAGTTSSGKEDKAPVTRKSLVSLHLRLKRALANEKRERSMYELYVRQAIDYQVIFEPNGPPMPTSRTTPLPSAISGIHAGRTSSSTLGALGHGGSPRPVPVEVSRWRGTIKPILFRVQSVACTVLSLVIVWCEGTILLDGRPFNLNLSPLSHLFRWLGRGGGGAGVVLALFIPILYCAGCTYFAMFRMKLLDGMTLHPNQHSDGSSLLFNATYACRLGPAICFNYLKLLHAPWKLYVSDDVKRTAMRTMEPDYFSKTVFGKMDHMPPPFGEADLFNNYVPLLIVVLCGCTYLNLFSGLASCCAKCCPCVGTPTFSFDDDFSDQRIDHGAQILSHEKTALVEGTPLGANLQCLSGATSDSEEGRGHGCGPARHAAAARRFNRLEDGL